VPVLYYLYFCTQRGTTVLISQLTGYNNCYLNSTMPQVLNPSLTLSRHGWNCYPALKSSMKRRRRSSQSSSNGASSACPSILTASSTSSYSSIGDSSFEVARFPHVISMNIYSKQPTATGTQERNSSLLTRKSSANTNLASLFVPTRNPTSTQTSLGKSLAIHGSRADDDEGEWGQFVDVSIWLETSSNMHTSSAIPPSVPNAVRSRNCSRPMPRKGNRNGMSYVWHDFYAPCF